MAAENHFLPFWAAVCVVGVNLGLLSVHVHSCGDIVSASILIVSTYILSNGPEHCAIQLATASCPLPRPQSTLGLGMRLL